MPRRLLNKPWTDADDQTIREMAAANKSPRLIAAKIGRSVKGVRGRAVKLGIKLETISEARQRMGLKCAEVSLKS